MQRNSLKCGEEFNATQQQLIGDMPRGKRLVVQMQETFREKRQPAFVDKLDARNWRKSQPRPAAGDGLRR